MTYVNAMLCAVPTANRETYREHAEKFATMVKEYGAAQVMDCWGEDIPEGTLTSMPMAVKRKDDETVCLSWIVWPSKQVADEAWNKMREDERMSPGSMPFDGKRMIFGGFQPIAEG